MRASGETRIDGTHHTLSFDAEIVDGQVDVERVFVHYLGRHREISWRRLDAFARLTVQQAAEDAMVAEFDAQRIALSDRA